jgi:hypothetical protein
LILKLAEACRKALAMREMGGKSRIPGHGPVTCREPGTLLRHSPSARAGCDTLPKTRHPVTGANQERGNPPKIGRNIDCVGRCHLEASMKCIVAALALLVTAGSFAAASERGAVRESSPASVIAQFSQAIPPEPPVVAELPEHHHAVAAAAGCCRMAAGKPMASRHAKGGGCCACCQKAAPGAKSPTR